MAAVIRPRFGRPCFECRDVVPTQRVAKLYADAQERGERLLKSDLLCVRCAEGAPKGATVERPKSNR